MTNTNKKIVNSLLAIDIVIITICIFMGDRDWLYTSQVGFFTSALVISASMMSYRRMVDKRLAQGAVPFDDDRDDIDKIDDPHDLYSKDIVVDEERDLAETLKEEKAKLKENRRSITEVAKDSKASFSFFRLGAYILLVIGFFYLNSNGYLHIPSYLITLSIPPMVIVFVLLSESKAKQKEIEAKNDQ